MQTMFLIMTLFQTTNVATPTRSNLAEWNKSIVTVSKHLVKLTHDGKFAELETTLTKLQSLYSKASDDGYEIVAMSTFLNAIIEEDVRQHEAELRTVCLPFAETIVTKELPIPGPADLHNAQIRAYFSVLDQAGTEAGRMALKADDRLRMERVQTLVTIWLRVVRSRQYYAKEFPPKLIAEINKGESRLELPGLPESLATVPLISGQSPNEIKDPAIRKEYKAYLD